MREPGVREVVFDREKVAAVTGVSRDFLANATLESSDVPGFITNQLTYRMWTLVMSQPLGRLVVEYPAGPWEHFRARYFNRTRLGRWLVKRKPIRYTYVARSARAIFPEANYMPEVTGPVKFLVREEYPEFTS